MPRRQYANAHERWRAAAQRVRQRRVAEVAALRAERERILAPFTPATPAEAVQLYHTEKAMSEQRNAAKLDALWARIDAAIAKADAEAERAAKGGRKRGLPICVGRRGR